MIYQEFDHNGQLVKSQIERNKEVLLSCFAFCSPSKRRQVVEFLNGNRQSLTLYWPDRTKVRLVKE